MSKPIIEIKNLSKAYIISHEAKAAPGTLTLRESIAGIAKKPIEIITGHKLEKEKFWALKDVSVEIDEGDVVGIVGRNGSGKSTLLKILSRIVEPTGGEIIMYGKPASLLEVGTGFHPELTGRENVYFNGSVLGMKKKEIDAKFDEIVAFSEVEQFLDTPVKFYSSGMYVRLAFAVAAHLEPDILIVDEVLAVGDAGFQKKSLAKMQEVAGQGRTVLFVSHNMASVKALCNKAIWLDKGKVVSKGPIDEVIDSYSKASFGPNDKLGNRTRNANLGKLAKFSDIKIISKGATSDNIDSTKDLFVKIKISSKEEIKEKLILSLKITSSGQPIIVLSHQLNGLKKGINNIDCTIKPTNLLGGAYSLDCSLELLNKTNSSLIDHLVDARSFIAENIKASEVGDNQREAIYFVDSHITVSE